MKNRENKTDSLFRKAYQEYETAPSPAAWKRISHLLDEQDQAMRKIRSNYPNRLLPLLALLLLSTGLQHPVRMQMTVPASSSQPAFVSELTGLQMKVHPAVRQQQHANVVNPSLNNFETAVPHPALPGGAALMEKPMHKPLIRPRPGLQNGVISGKYFRKEPGPYWTLSAFFAYEHAAYRLDNDLPASYQDDKHQILEREKHEPSFSAGVLADWHFHRRWSFETGLFYGHTSIHIDPQKLFASIAPDGSIVYKYTTSAGYTYLKAENPVTNVGDSLYTTEAKLNLQSISVPLVLKYRAGKRKLAVSPAAGVALNVLTSARLKTEVVDRSNQESEYSERLEGNNKHYWSALFSAEIRYQINKRTHIHATPFFRYAITPLTKNNVVESFPYSAGLAIGAGIKF